MKPAKRGKARQPNRAETFAALARVDWLRHGQRLAVFLRQIRGDHDEAINADHARELVRARQVRATVEQFARNLTGRDVPTDSDDDPTADRKVH